MVVGEQLLSLGNEKKMGFSFAFHSFIRNFVPMKRRRSLLCLISVLLSCCTLQSSAQYDADFSKMSGLVRLLAKKSLAKDRNTLVGMAPAVGGKEKTLCAFVKVADADSLILLQHGCRPLACFGDIFIADIPISQLGPLSMENDIERIEANRSHSLHIDKSAHHVNATAVQLGEGLPQAYSGRGVVMGIMDVGFDLTHPNFFDASGERYRIKALWDQLSADTIASPHYVGADYVGEDALLGYAHSRDGLILTHGTHTLGCAAGSGAGTPYRGIAPESDICLVSNAVSDDLEFIAEEDLYKYTYATDALGFKYIFDYAEAHGQPCVISFSEGSEQDFRGYDILYNEVLDSLTAKPGRVIVASAGNNGHQPSYFHKPRGTASMGSFLYALKSVFFQLKSPDAFTLRLKGYVNGRIDTFDIPLPQSQADSAYTAPIGLREHTVTVSQTTSCYDKSETAFEVTIETGTLVGAYDSPLSIEIVGEQADVAFYKGSGNLITRDLDPTLNAGEMRYSVQSPGCAESVICVGATTYSKAFTNIHGETISNEWGANGQRAAFSSIGPTFDDRIKPDVVAPGVDIVSSLSSYYIEGSPEGESLNNCVEYFQDKGRTYGWMAATGTSMSAPIIGGAIALWLEANPSLTREEVMDIIRQTSTHPDASLPYPNDYYGHGQIDVYRGLLAALNLLGINGLSTHQPQKATIRPADGRQVVITFNERQSQPFTLEVFSTNGQIISTHQMPAGNSIYKVALDNLNAGIYAIQLTAASSIHSGSTLIRLDR